MRLYLRNVKILTRQKQPRDLRKQIDVTVQ